MKIKISNQKNKIILLDNTKSPHTKAIVESILSTLDENKKIIDIRDIIGNKYYLNPMDSYCGLKSLVNNILPKINSTEHKKQLIEKSRIVLLNTLLLIQRDETALSPYLLHDKLQSSSFLSQLSQEISDLSLNDFNHALNLIKENLDLIRKHPFIDNADRKPIDIQSAFNKEAIYYMRMDNDDDIITYNLIVSMIKSIKTDPTDKWKVFSDAFINEINLFNTSPTFHSEEFLNKF